MTVNIILIFIFANVLGGLTWQLKKENQNEGIYLLITSIISVVFLISNIFVMEFISDALMEEYKGIILAIFSPLTFTLLMIIFGVVSSKKALTDNKPFKEWLSNNFLGLLMRIAIVSIYAFISLMILFLIYFSLFGYVSTRFDISEVSNTLTLLGIVTTLFGILISLYEKLK